MFTDFAEKITQAAESVPFDTLALIVFGSYLAVYLAAFVLTLAVPAIRKLSKRPLLCLANAYAAVTLALFATRTEFENAVVIAALFWVAAYLFYGLLCAVGSKRKKSTAYTGKNSYPAYAPYSAPQPPVAVPARPRGDVPAAKSCVRLEHAVTITDKLLQKNLGKSDRQELEKLKNTLAVLQIKGTLSPTEAEILNGNFNTLLKLMAKYDV